MAARAPRAGDTRRVEPSVAELVAALLSHPHRPDASRLPVLGGHPSASTPASGLAGAPPGPSILPPRLADSAAHLAVHPPPVSDPERGPLPPWPHVPGLPSGPGMSTWWMAPGYDASESESDDGMPELFCPGPVRDDPALGEAVNNRLVDWAEQVGLYPGRLERLRSYGFGRLMMLAHPGTDDLDRLLAATKCLVAEWVADDYYVDEVDLGADPEILGSRLALLYSVIVPAPLPSKYAPQLDEYRRGEPIAMAFRTAMEHLARYASTTQIGRFQQQMGIMFIAWGQEADWTRNGRTPAVWEYLVQRHLNSYTPPIILADVVAGYELPAHEFYDPRVRRTIMRAGAANVLLNDLYSAAFESETDFNLPRVIAIEEGCSREEAVRRTVEIHNEQMRTFVREAATLSLTGSPMLQRFFVDTWAWMGGSREWHATTQRYQGGNAG